MVFSSLVTSLLNRFLSPFVDEVTASQLAIFAWSGTATLSNVSLRANALDGLKLPLRIVHGHVGSIEAKVPWMNLYSEPIIIKVSDVYLLALPNWEVAYSEEEERQYAWQAKKAALDTIEEMKQKVKDEQLGKKENDGFLVKLFVTAIKNFQISVHNVHVLFEDSTTYGSKNRKVLQIGCFFSKLEFLTDDGNQESSSSSSSNNTTTNNNNTSNNNTNNDLLINKRISLDGFSVYMNTKRGGRRLYGLSAQELNQVLKERITFGACKGKKGKKMTAHSENSILAYILCPINFNTDAVVHRMPEADGYRLPIVDLKMNLDYFRLQLSSSQIEAALMLLKAVERRKLSAPSRKWRPEVPIEGNPRKWWHFLLTATLESGLRQWKRQYCWAAIEHSCRTRKRYTELYKAKLLREPPLEEKGFAELELCERELNLIAIVLARNQAETEALVAVSMAAAQKAKLEKSSGKSNQNNGQQQKSSPEASRSWFSRRFWGFWGSNPEEDRNRNVDPALVDLRDQFLKDGEERAKLYQAIGYDKDKDRWILYPPEYIAHRATFCIKMLKVVIKDNEGEDSSSAEKSAVTVPKLVSLLNIELDTCSFDVSRRPSSGNFLFKMALSRLTVVGVNNVMLLKGRLGERQLLACAVEVAPLDRLSDLRVSLQLGNLYLLYDIETINRLYGVVVRRPKKAADADADEHHLTLEEIQSLAQSHQIRLSTDWRLLVESAFERHKQLQLDVSVEPSFLIIPRAGCIATADDVVLVSLGKFRLTSKLVPKSNKRKIYRMLTSKRKDEGGGGGLEMLVYEQCSVRVSHVQLVLSNRLLWRTDLDRVNTERHIVFPFEVHLDIGRSIVPKEASRFAKVTISGTIPKIEMKASDKQFSTLLGLLTNLPLKPQTAATAAQTSTTAAASCEVKINQPAPNTKNPPFPSNRNDQGKNAFELVRKTSKTVDINHLEVAEAASYATKAVEEKTISSRSAPPSEAVDIGSGQETLASTTGSSAIESNIISSDKGEGAPPAKELKFEFTLNRALLTVFAGNRQPESALGEATLVVLAIQGETLSGGGGTGKTASYSTEAAQNGKVLNILCTVADLVMEDTRACRASDSTGIRRMLEKLSTVSAETNSNKLGKAPTMLSVRLNQTSTLLSIVIALSSLRYSFALDYLIATVEMVTRAFAFLEPQPLPSTADSASITPTTPATTTTPAPQPAKTATATTEKSIMSTSVQIDMDKVEVILLESLEVLDAVACICNCAFTFRLQADPAAERIDMTGRLIEATVGVANYLAYVGEAGKLDEYLMSPTEMELVGEVVGGVRQKIALRFSDIYISISPQMVNIVLGILSRMGSTDSSAANGAAGADQDAIAAGADFLLPKRIDRSQGWFAAARAKLPAHRRKTRGAAKAKDDHDEVVKKDLSGSQLLTISVEHIKVLIKYGSAQVSHPLLRLSLAYYCTLVDSRQFTFDCQLLVDYFNAPICSWEPLVEPVSESQPLDVLGLLQLTEETTSLQLNIPQNLEILLTKSAIGVISTTCSQFSSAIFRSASATKGNDGGGGGPQQVTKYHRNRISVSNYLGIPLVVKVQQSALVPLSDFASVSESDDHSVVIESGCKQLFSAFDVTNLILHVVLPFAETEIVERTIVCSRTSIRCYFTSHKTYPPNECWKWVVHVHDSGDIKKIVFRTTTQINNLFDCPILLYSFDGQQTTFISTIEPKKNMYLPFSVVYGQSLLYIRPSPNFEMSDVPVDWRSIDISDDEEGEEEKRGDWFSSQDTIKLLILSCKEKNTSPARYFSIKVRGEKFIVLHENEEHLNNPESYIYHIKLLPFVRLKNLLPYPMQFHYDPTHLVFTDLGPGEEKILPYAVFGETYITYKVLNYLGQDWIAIAILPKFGRERDDHYYSFEAVAAAVVNENENEKAQVQVKEKLTLAVNFCVEAHSLTLSVYAPFWMVNRTGEELAYKVDSRHLFHHRASLQRAPFLLAFNPQKVSRRRSAGADRLRLSVRGSRFSEPFPLNVVPYSGSLLPASEDKTYRMAVSVRVQLAGIGLSKIVTISPFYIVYNISKRTIEFSENDRQWRSVASQCSQVFFPYKTSRQTMAFRVGGNPATSGHVSLCSSSQTLLPINDYYLFVEVEVSEVEAKIKLSDYFYGAAPALIVNDLSVPVLYGQSGVTEWAKGEGEGEENTFGQAVSVLPPKQMCFFCWLDPMGTRQLVYRIPQMPQANGVDGVSSKEDEICLDFDQYQTMDEQGTAGWVTFFDGKQRVLIFTDSPELPLLLLNTEELIKPKFSLELFVKGVGLNVVNEEKKKDLFYMSIRSSCVWEGCEPDKSDFKPLSLKESALLEEMYQEHLSSRQPSIARKTHRVNFAEMRLTAPRHLALQRLTNSAFWLQLSTAEHITQLHLKVASLQVDNQLPDHVYAVVFCPAVTRPRRHEQLLPAQTASAKSFVEVSAIVQSLAGSKVTRIKYAQVLVQEFLVQLDLGWAVQFIELLPEGFELGGVKGDQARINEDLEEIAKNDTLLEMQHFGMGKTYYDYLLLGPMKLHLSVTMGDLPEGKMPAFVDTAVRFTGLTLAEINGALFKLDYFERQQWACSDEELANAIVHHYALQLAAQLYKLILGLDIIGNPGKLASDITKGVGDFFYEPAAGIVLGPREFAAGVATGVHSLTTNLVGGTAAALGRIGHRLGTGVAVLSADEKFQKERRERTNKEATFAASGKHLVRGFVDGFTGLVSKPVEGAQRSGFGGLLRGLGQGLVGVIVQPTTGVLDAAATGLQAFSRSIDATKTVALPARPPRHFPAGRKLAPYNLYTATGNQHLRSLADGKYAAEGEEYEYHLQLDGQRMVLLSTGKIFALKKSLFAGAWDIDWTEDWSRVQAVTVVGDRLRLTVKSPSGGGGGGGGFCFYFGSGPLHRTIIIDRTNEEHSRELVENVRRHVEEGSAPDVPPTTSHQ